MKTSYTKFIIASIASLLIMSNNITEFKSNASSKKDIMPKSQASCVFKDSTVETVIDDSMNIFTQSFTRITNKIYNDATKPKPIEVQNMEISQTALTEIKITWDAEDGREYEVAYCTSAEYAENITFVYQKAGLCYITGLRIDSDYAITVTPIIKENENLYSVPMTKNIHTPNPEVIQEFDYEDGWTCCFAGEKASGLTAMPSSGAIYGSTCDTVTGTGIRRHSNGDYACAMGTHYGYCGDRFLIELENGIQFTTRICDSKGCGDVQDEYGLGLYHNFGGYGKCIIEFIWDDGNLPGTVAYTGSWGGYNWNGLNLGANIKSIQKLATY